MNAAPIVLPRLSLKDNAGEACAKCRFWFTDSAKEMPAKGDQPAQLVAICRRFPPQILLANIAVRGNPRMVSGRIVEQQAEMRQVPQPFQVATKAEDWCGEFRLSLAAQG